MCIICKFSLNIFEEFDCFYGKNTKIFCLKNCIFEQKIYIDSNYLSAFNKYKDALIPHLKDKRDINIINNYYSELNNKYRQTIYANDFNTIMMNSIIRTVCFNIYSLNKLNSE